MVTFQQAYEAAAARFAPEAWADLRPDLRINAIYEEMRRLDAEATAVVVDPSTTHCKEHVFHTESRRADQEQLERIVARDLERRNARPDHEVT